MKFSTGRYLSRALITLVLEGVAVLHCQTKASLPQTATEVYSRASTHTEAVIVSMETYHITEPPPDPRLSGCRAGRVKGKHGVIDHEGTYLWRDADEQTWHGPCL